MGDEVSCGQYFQSICMLQPVKVLLGYSLLGFVKLLSEVLQCKEGCVLLVFSLYSRFNVLLFCLCTKGSSSESGRM